MSASKEMLKWMNVTNKFLAEETSEEEERAKEREKARAKLAGDLQKTNKDLMKMKVDKLNMLIKKKYYDAGKDQEIAEDDMFQFHFSETSKGYEFQIPLNVLFGKRTQAFCAQYWDDFFDQAGIRTDFEDNIHEALEKAANIHLTMTIAKDMESEEGEEFSEEEEESDEGFDIEDEDAEEPEEDEEF